MRILALVHDVHGGVAQCTVAGYLSLYHSAALDLTKSFRFLCERCDAPFIEEVVGAAEIVQLQLGADKARERRLATSLLETSLNSVAR